MTGNTPNDNGSNGKGNGKQDPQNGSPSNPQKKTGKKPKQMIQGKGNNIASDGSKQFTKATKSEAKERVRYAGILICEGKFKHEIKRLFKTTYGVSGRTADRYICLAREQLAKSCPGGDVSVEQIRQQHFAISMGIVNREQAMDKDRIAALKHAGALYGLEAPQKIARTFADGTDVTIDEQAARLLRAINHFRKRLPGPNGSG